MNKKDRIKAPDWIFARPVETECSYGYVLEKDASKGAIEYIRADSLPKIHGWVARDMNGDVNLFVLPPDREVGYWSSFDKCDVPIPEELFPNIKWEDSPIEVELLIRKV